MTQQERGLARTVLVVVGLGTFLAQLDGTVMNVALPTVAKSFHASGLGAVQPVITAYLVANVALLPVLGKVADRYGRKRLFLIGFSVFGMASLLAVGAPSLPALVALRVLQAFGGAMLSGTSLAIVARAAGSRRGASLGQLAVVFALAGLLGPPIGGGLVQAFGWPAVFWINVPLSLIGLLAGLRWLASDDARPATGTVDLLGTLLFAAATALVTAGLAGAGGGSPWFSLLPVVLGLALYGTLLWWEARADAGGIDPLLDLHLLRTPAYGLGLLLAFLSNGVSIALFVLVPFWLARGWHAGAAAQGAVFLPLALSLGASAPLAGKRADVIGARLLTTAGMCVGAVAATVLAVQATMLVWPAVVVAMALLGAASGLFAAPNNSAVLAAAHAESLAVASSMLSAARTLGVIIGVSAFSATYDALRGAHGSNTAARGLFLVAAAIYMLTAVLCWTVRDDQSPADPQA